MNNLKRHGGEFQKKTFSIEASQEAFRILSDGLYSDKISAVIRELSTNALDSHIQANNKERFVVHLPSRSEPWFSVRDFGLGLSHEDVIGIYSTYFGTNKKDDLSTTGCLGLGSKSPLAKVCSFNVTSIFNGIKRHYIVVLNEDKIPEVNYLPEQDEETVQKNGVEVKLAVSSYDIREYIEKAQRIYSIFKEEHRPSIVNCDSFSYYEDELILHGKNWSIKKNNSQAIVVQSNVSYPIRSELFDNLNNRHQNLLDCGICLEFENGEIQFTPSREHLSYTKSTINKIKRRLEEVSVDIEQLIHEKIEECDSLWDARVFLWSLLYSHSFKFRHLRTFLSDNKLTWKNKEVSCIGIEIPEDVLLWHIIGKESNKNSGKTTVSKTEHNRITAKPNIQWFEYDLPRGNFSRCAEYIRDTCSRDSVYLVKFNEAINKQDFILNMGFSSDPFVKTSTLTKYENKKRQARKSLKTSILEYVVKDYRCSCVSGMWKETSIDIDKKFASDIDNSVGIEYNLYVETRNNLLDAKNPDICNFDTDPYTIKYILDILKEIDVKYKNLKIYGTRPKVAEKIKKSDNWVNFFSFSKKIIEEKIKNLSVINFGKYIESSMCGFKNENIWKLIANVYNEYFEKLDNENPVKDFVTSLNKVCSICKKHKAEYVKWNEIANKYKIDYKQDRAYDFSSMRDKILEEFPMVQYFEQAKKESYGTPKIADEDVGVLLNYLSYKNGEKKCCNT
jgi:hypothetical protein